MSIPKYNKNILIENELDIDIFVEKLCDKIKNILFNKKNVITTFQVEKYNSIYISIRSCSVDEIKITVSKNWVKWRVIFIYLPSEIEKMEKVNYSSLVIELYNKLNKECFKNNKEY